MAGRRNQAPRTIQSHTEWSPLIHDVANWFNIDNIVEAIDEHKTIKMFPKQKKTNEN